MKNLSKPAISIVIGLMSVSHVCASEHQGFELEDGIGIQSSDVTKTQNHIKEANWQELAQDIAWQRLLFVKQGQSSIKDDGFFLVDKHSDNLAYDELVAMTNALNNHDDELICRFPARATWLADKLGIPISLDECHAFNEWYQKHAVVKLSLVFAEEHPNQMGSAFAHVLMKGDTQASLASNDGTKALAINYTVARTLGDGEAGSGIKAMTGGYAGVMEFFGYADKRDVYLKKDNRNMWEYRLNLNEHEIEQIMRHIWEVKDVKRSYFFTHDNCATEILRLIDLVRPTENLRQSSGRVTIPSEIVRLLNDRGLIDDVKFLPSEHSKAQARLNDPNSLAITTHSDPRQSQSTHRLNVGVGVIDDKAYGNLGIRSAYHDVLDSPSGVRKFLDLSILSLDTKIDEDRFKIENLTIFSSRSYNPSNTAKAYTGTAWGRHLQFKQVIDGSDRNHDDHLVLHIGAETGRSWTVGQGAVGTGDLADTLCYALVGGMGEVGRINKGYRVGVSANVGCIHQMNDGMRMFGELSLPYWYQGDNVGRDSYLLPTARLGVQYDINHYHSIRLTGNVVQGYDETLSDVRVAWLRYF